MDRLHEEDSMDFEAEEPQYESQDPQTQSTQATQAASQHQEDLEKHLWGSLMPCNSSIARVDLWKLTPVYCVGRNATGNQIVFPGPKISASQLPDSEPPASPSNLLMNLLRQLSLSDGLG